MSKTWQRRDEIRKQDKERFKKWRRERKTHKGGKYVKAESN